MAVYLGVTALVIVLAHYTHRMTGSGNAERISYNAAGVSLRRCLTRQDMINRVVLTGIFLALFLVSALRINVGNDYGKFVEFMHLVYSDAYVPTEVGFNLLTLAIYHLCGFENYLLVFAVIAFITIAFFMAAMWQQSESFLWSISLFLLLGYYFQSISTIRYYLALGIALYSIQYVLKGDWPKFILLILVGATFHKSLLVVLLLYPLARMTWKRWMIIGLGILSLSCIFLQDLCLEILLTLYPSYRGTEYLSGGTSYMSIFRCLALLILVWIYRKEVCRADREEPDKTAMFYVRCNAMALVLYVFFSFVPVISRIGYYLTVTQLLLIPMLIQRIPEGRKKFLVKTGVIIFAVGYFAMYMRGASADGVRILPYQTFMFHDMPLTLSEVGY